ncbi:MAG: hypothetical protein WD773_08350 [Gemmatimonadales bacterium]
MRTLVNRSALAAALLMLSACRAVSNYRSPQAEIGPGKWRDQVRAVLADAARYPRATARTGIVRDTLRTSDHDPVWAVALFAPGLPD